MIHAFLDIDFEEAAKKLKSKYMVYFSENSFLIFVEMDGSIVPIKGLKKEGKTMLKTDPMYKGKSYPAKKVIRKLINLLECKVIRENL